MTDGRKTYGKIAFTEEELISLRGLASGARKRVIEAAQEATTPEQKSFYWSRADAYERLEKKLNQPFLNDSSQDAEPDEDDE